MSIRQTAEAFGLVKRSSTAMRRYAERYVTANKGRWPTYHLPDGELGARVLAELAHPAIRAAPARSGGTWLQNVRERARLDPGLAPKRPLERQVRVERRAAIHRERDQLTADMASWRDRNRLRDIVRSWRKGD